MTPEANGNDEVRFDGRVIMVTGAGRGMGRAHARLLGSRGAQVVVADNGVAMDGTAPSEGPAAEVVAEIVDAGGEAIAYTGDLSTEDGCDAAIAAAISEWGRIDGIVHNASISPNSNTADKMSTRDLEMMARINAFAALWLTRAAWPHMKQQNYGRLAYVASHSIYGTVLNTVYSSGKSAYIGLTRTIANEGFELGILANMIMPTGATRMTERYAESDYSKWLLSTMLPERMAPGVAYVMSEQSQIHGEMLSMGGGRIARVVLAENQGVQGLDSIEAVRDAMPTVLSDERYFYPMTLRERTGHVAKLMGFDGTIENLATRDVGVR